VVRVSDINDTEGKRGREGVDVRYRYPTQRYILQKLPILGLLGSRCLSIINFEFNS
jgi:hypothetical protein